METLARNDDRSPGRIIAASLRLYVRLSMEAQAAFRRGETCGSNDKRSALLAELNRAIIRAADAIPREQARPPGVKEGARLPVASASLSASASQAKVNVASESKEIFSITDFCRTYGVSRTTAYAELKGGQAEGEEDRQAYRYPAW